MKKVYLQDLGRVKYKETWDYQLQLLKEVIDRKMKNRTLSEENQPLIEQLHHFLLCEHHPVYTLGKSGSLDHLLLDEKGLTERDIDFFKINRGGDITYHGPGQIVGYPILDLDCFFTDVHKYVRFIEEAVIRTLAEYGLEADRIEGYTGVWFKGEKGQPNRKICAIGVHLSRWVTMHGFAFNVNTDLNYFNNIIPCGIVDKDKAVTSLAEEIGKTVDLNEVKVKLLNHFTDLFGFELIPMDEEAV